MARRSCRQLIGPIAAPDVIQFAPELPKTRSGKIMRRLLKKIANGEGTENFGDTSTLADPSVLEDLVKSHTGLSQHAARAGPTARIMSRL